MGWITSFPNSYVKAWTVPQNVTVFRDRSFKKLTKLKWGHEGEWVPIWLLSLLEEEIWTPPPNTRHACAQRKNNVRTFANKKVAMCKPGRALSGNQHPDLGLLNLQNCDKQTSAGLATRLRCFVRAARADEGTQTLAWDSQTPPYSSEEGCSVTSHNERDQIGGSI